MKPELLLRELAERQVTLTAHEGKLRAQAPLGVLTPELSSLIRDNKTALLSLLSAPASAAVSESEPRTTGPGSEAIAEPSLPLPLSVTQIRQAGAARSGSCLPIVLRLLGPLNRDALTESLQTILRRHAPLRSSFQLEKDPPTQLIENIQSLPVEFTNMEGHADQENAALDLVKALTAQPFDITAPPLMRAHVVRMGPGEHWLFTAFSPLVIDGWSFDVFWHELRTTYIALTSGQPIPLPPLQMSYAELSTWQNERVEERRHILEEFWGRELGHQLPPLPLPTDHPRPPLSDHRAGNVVYTLGQETETALRALARREGSTPQMVMLTAFYIWLFRLSGQADLVVASPAAARLHPASESVIGPFVNLMLLRMKLEGQLSFKELLSQVRDRCLDAYDHQELPLEQLRVRSSSAAKGAFAPAFQAEFSFQMVNNRSHDMGELRIVQLEHSSGAATNDITMWVKDWGTQIKGAVEYKAELFEHATVRSWVDGYVRVLTYLVEHPDAEVRAAELMTADGAKMVRDKLCALDTETLGKALDIDLSGKRIDNVEILDADLNLLPLGCFGRLVVATDAEVVEGAKRVRLTALGTLEKEELAIRQSVAVQYRAPQTDLEQQLVKLFASLLESPHLGMDHDFFECGGNSLLAVALFNEIARITGVRLPFTAVLEAPTPRLLALRIKQGANHNQSTLLCLKEGAKQQAIYLVHDGDGETLLYRNLAERLGSGLSVFGINPRAAGPIPSALTTVEEMAKHYTAEIVRHQSTGPYVIGGLCAGGVVAYEVARLLAQNHPGTKLILLDAAPPFARRKQTAITHRASQFADLTKAFGSGSRKAAVQSGLRKLTGGLRYELSNQVQRARARLQVEAAKRLVDSPSSWPAWLDIPRFRDIWHYAESRYQGAPTNQLDVVLVRATEGTGGDLPSRDILTDPTFDWQQLIQTPIRSIDVPGGHSSMLQTPHVDVLAALLRKQLDLGIN